MLIFLVSCNTDFLDPNNPNAITSFDVWGDEKLIEMYVNSLYNDVPGYDHSHTLDNITDEGRNNYPTSVSKRIIEGQWDEVSNPMDFWAYGAVRKANEFLARIDEVIIDANTQKRLKGEVRFLRALIYFKMVKRYGGIPIIKEPQSLEDDLEVKRNTLEECFTFIEEELNQAIEELPVDAPRGRAGKGAAMALKGRVALFYASPLYNESNDVLRWQKAALASKSVIDLGKYSLYPDHNTLWLEKGANSEAIFEIQYKMPEKQHSWDSGIKPLRLANNRAGELSPLQELVDAFPMKNGKAITDPGSGYNPDHPYLGRDDRFYAYIAYNGSKMKGTTSGPPVQEITLEIYKGGIDYDANPAFQVYNTYTGYFTRKAVDPENSIYTGTTGSTQPWLEIRYAEVLLNYAEAQNEFLANPDASIYDALNEIRRRAGITGDIPHGSLNKDEMRKLIRNERYIELCLEKKRYWDIRRWKLATTLLNNRRYSGVVITKNGNGSFSYEYVPVDPQPNVFSEKMYWMPIPRSEITRNRNLEQNPGWN